MEEKRFRKNDDSFICVNCGKEVLPLGYSSRNHCPFCLCSVHVDINPGDRANECGGLLVPVRAETDSKKGYIIVHKCARCGEIRRNRAAHEAKVQPDDLKKLIKLTAGEYDL
ncbi:MAG: RNHCP domain-containing protein [Clostridia bacterium]|nr:RNHCP domain-containing protein [Clostridia bacterium]